MEAAEATTYDNAQEETRTSRWHVSLTLVPPILFSLFYFVEVYLRASEKYFWYDELTTLYVCRLPLSSMWDALRHGIDFNPPLFFLLTDLSKAVFGETLVGMRVPEILGFWVLCICLYRVVNRRVGWLPGSIAMTLPLITGAFYYSYEARPHAIVLGFSGLAVVCWQMSLEKPESRWWLASFSLCLLGAFLLHCYAVLVCAPFAAFELRRVERRRRIYWPMWIAMVVPALIAGVVYVPLLISYHAYMKGTDYETTFPPSVGALTAFYLDLLSPCIVVVLMGCALFALVNIGGLSVRSFLENRQSRRPTPEIIIALAFLLLPFLGIILAKAVGGPFFGRYFMSTTIGLCILFGFGAGAARQPVNPIAVALMTLVLLPAFWNLAALSWHRAHGIAEDMHEPSSGFSMNSAVAGPLARYQLLLSSPKTSEPIAILDPLDYFYLLHYAPGLRPRIYYIQGPANDAAFMGFRNFQHWAPFKFNRGLTSQELLESFPRSLVYGRTTSLMALASIVRAGGNINSMQFSENHFLVDLEASQKPR